MPFQYDKNFIELRKNPNDHFYYKVGDKVRIVDTDEIGTVCELINEKYYVVRVGKNRNRLIFHESEIA